jgi:hypothetical protein
MKKTAGKRRVLWYYTVRIVTHDIEYLLEWEFCGLWMKENYKSWLGMHCIINCRGWFSDTHFTSCYIRVRKLWMAYGPIPLPPNQIFVRELLHVTRLPWEQSKTKYSSGVYIFSKLVFMRFGICHWSCWHLFNDTVSSPEYIANGTIISE